MITSFQTSIMFKYSSYLPRVKLLFHHKHRPPYSGNFYYSQKCCHRNVIKSEIIELSFFVCLFHVLVYKASKDPFEN